MKNWYQTSGRPRLRKFASAIGIKRNRDRVGKLPPDFDELTRRVVEQVTPFTMTSSERIASLVETARYVAANNIEGDYAEAGVWRGGSTMAVALVFKELGDTGRDLYLYDTYEGMSAPTDADVDLAGTAAAPTFEQRKLGEDTSEWCRSPIEEVEQNMRGTGYPTDKVHLIKGKVEDTIPSTMPKGKLSILRLDTDWYESTLHEMEHLYPLLVPGGVLILDDYGYWEGSRRAVDEYFERHGIRPLFNRIDYAGRLIIKQ